MEKLRLSKMRRGIEHETKYFLASSSQLNLVWCGSLESRFCIIPFSQQRHSGRRLFLPGKRRCQQSRPTGTIESVRTTVRDAASLGKYYNGVAVQIDQIRKTVGLCDHRRRRGRAGLHVHAASGFRSRCANRCIGEFPNMKLLPANGTCTPYRMIMV